MARRPRGSPARFRIGRVSVYPHHGTWWIYYRDRGSPVRRKIGGTRVEAEQIAAQVNSQLASGSPTMLSFVPVSVPELRRLFLDHHDGVLRSSVATVRRYRTATGHLEDYVGRHPRPPLAHEVRADAFAAYLRTVEVAPNGHPNTPRRRLRDKGAAFVLETCRAMYAFAARRRNLPPYAGNPFTELRLDRLKVCDAKPIFVFAPATELAFFHSADFWVLPIHFTLAKTGLRVGELVHLLIEDLDLDGGWLTVRNKAGLGWRIKTGHERRVPLLPEVAALLQLVVGARRAGPVFLRRRFANSGPPPLAGDRAALERVCQQRQRELREAPTRTEALRVANTVWRDAGAITPDAVRTAFMHVMRANGHSEATCPKSWRHTFATLLQDANVDPLVRQITLGHRPTTGSGLGMTAAYTHTRPETQRNQIERALRLWPQSLAFAQQFVRDHERDLPRSAENTQQPQDKEVMP